MKKELRIQATTNKLITTIHKANFYYITPIFNLIQNCSKSGYFNNIYLLPRYQAGLALQLFSILLLGKIRLPNGIWYKATLYVISHKSMFVGFALIRSLVPSGSAQEIYMCAVKEKHRGNGFGKQLIQSILNNGENISIIEAECLPKSVHMKRLLCRLGFKSVKSRKTTNLLNIAEKFRLSFQRGI